jgi:hypothetical protein
MHVLVTWSIRIALCIAAGAIWAGILARHGVNKPLFFQLWSNYAWLTAALVIGYHIGARIGRAMRRKSGSHLALLAVLLAGAAVAYGAGYFLPRPGAGMGNPLVYPIGYAFMAFCGFLRWVCAEARELASR